MGFYFLCFIVIIKYYLSIEEIKTIKIGLSFPFEDEYWKTYVKYFNESADVFKDEGIKFEIKVKFSKRSVSIQQADLENLIANKIDVLIITAHDTKASKNIIKYCELIDIPIIAFNRLISDVELKAYISPNMTQAGQYQAEFLLKNLKNNKTNKTNFLVMKGPESDINSKLLFDGAMNIFRADPKTKNNVDNDKIFKIMIVPNWDPNEAKKLCSKLDPNFLKDLGYIVAANDDIGKSCISELKNLNFNEIYMAGHDYSIDSIKDLFEKLKDNYFTVDMNQSSDTLIALNVSKNLVLGKPFEFKETFKNGQYDNPYLCGNVSPINYDTFKNLTRNESNDNKW